MATVEERAALLATTCPHCHAATGELCSAPIGGRPLDSQGGKRRALRAPITTLDGGCHDARWLAAVGRPAPVLQAVVAELHPHTSPSVPLPAQSASTPDLVSAGGDRPW